MVITFIKIPISSYNIKVVLQVLPLHEYIRANFTRKNGYIYVNADELFF